ncbi:MAG TPA: urease accessory protein UreD [Beijerinckiaceae bacterium]
MTSPPLASSLPAFVRAQGGVRLAIGQTGRGSRALNVAESGGYRVRFPRTQGPCEGVLINTGGGLAGGDGMRIEVVLAPGTEVVLTTQAAEKIYRSDGPDTRVAIDLTLEKGSRLDWLPQEQILFDGARLHRRLDVAMAGHASLLLVESTVFGRHASGEVLQRGSFRDRWRLRRDGRLVFAEEVRLDGDLRAVLDRPALGGGAAVVATLLLVAPGAEARLETLRTVLAEGSCEAGASAYDGMLVARLLGTDARALRSDLARLIRHLTGRALPRSWQT